MPILRFGFLRPDLVAAQSKKLSWDRQQLAVRFSDITWRKCKMHELKEVHQERAEIILKSVEGLSIAEAQWLLNWCVEYLLEQTVSFRRFIPHDSDSEKAEVTQKCCCLCSPTVSL